MYFFLLVIVTIVFWGTAPIFEKTALKNLNPAEGVLLRSLVIAVFMIAFVGISGQHEGLRNLNWKTFALVVAGALISGALGQMAYFAALKNGRTSMIVPLVASYPLVTVILSTSLLGEPITFWRVAGAVMVVGGVALVKLG